MKTPTADNYTALRQRLGSASTAEALAKLEASATRIYNAGLLSVSEFRRLDVAIMEKLARL